MAGVITVKDYVLDAHEEACSDALDAAGLGSAFTNWWYETGQHRKPPAERADPATFLRLRGIPMPERSA